MLQHRNGKRKFLPPSAVEARFALSASSRTIEGFGMRLDFFTLYAIAIVRSSPFETSARGIEPYRVIACVLHGKEAYSSKKSAKA